LKLVSEKSKVRIEDLGITLYPGTPVSVEDGLAESSGCLKALRSMGKVEVVQEGPMKPRVHPQFSNSQRANRVADKYRRLGQTVAPPPVQEKEQLQPQVKTRQPPKVKDTLTRSEAEDMARLAAKVAAEEATKMVMGAIGEMVNSIEDKIGLTVSNLSNTPRQVVSVGTVTRPRADPGDEVNGEEPVFIPKGIVREDTESLVVNTASSAGSDMDDTVSALKSLKSLKPKK
jgi:hypothetical protein